MFLILRLTVFINFGHPIQPLLFFLSLSLSLSLSLCVCVCVCVLLADEKIDPSEKEPRYSNLSAQDAEANHVVHTIERKDLVLRIR